MPSGYGPQPWVGNWKQVDSEIVSLTGSGLIVAANPFRVAINFSCVASSGFVWVHPHSVGLLGQGWPMSANGTQSFFFSQWGGIVQDSWYYFVSTPGGNLFCLESIWVPTE